eukprot:m51a1_g10063 hypothetical protein (598) ;mRNA; f:84676-86900
MRHQRWLQAARQRRELAIHDLRHLSDPEALAEEPDGHSGGCTGSEGTGRLSKRLAAVSLAFADCVPGIMQQLRAGDTGERRKALKGLVVITAGTKLETRKVVDCGALPLLFSLLSAPDHDVRESAVRVLCNIAGNSVELRDAAIASGVLPPLLELLSSSSATGAGLVIATSALANLCRYRPDDGEVVLNACISLSHIAHDASAQPERAEAVVRAGALPHLDFLAKHSPSAEVRALSLHVAGCLACGSADSIEAVVRSGILSTVRELVASPEAAARVREEAALLASNVLAGSRTRLQAAIDAGLMLALVGAVEGAHEGTRKTAAWAVCNACISADCSQAEARPQLPRSLTNRPVDPQYLMRIGCVQALCKTLTRTDEKIVLHALEALAAILESGRNGCVEMVKAAGGEAAIEMLQMHSNTVVYETARAMQFDPKRRGKSTVLSNGNATACGTRDDIESWVVSKQEFVPSDGPVDWQVRIDNRSPQVPVFGVVDDIFDDYDRAPTGRLYSGSPGVWGFQSDSTIAAGELSGDRRKLFEPSPAVWVWLRLDMGKGLLTLYSGESNTRLASVEIDPVPGAKLSPAVCCLNSSQRYTLSFFE